MAAMRDGRSGAVDPRGALCAVYGWSVPFWMMLRLAGVGFLS